MSQLSVVMVSSVFYPSIGGAQTHTLRLSRKLRERGIDVRVITRHYAGLARDEVVDGVPVHRVGRGDSNKAVAALTFIGGAMRWLWAQRHAYQIIHCHQMISPMTIGLLAHPVLRKPVVINPHRSGPIGDVELLRRRRRMTGRLRMALARRWGAAFVSISDGVHRELRDIGICEQKIQNIPNGVDVEHFHPVNPHERAQLREALALPQGPLAVFTGRLVPEKGVDVLVEAWPQVQRAVPDAQLVIVGEGAAQPELESQAQKLGVDEPVHFVGGTSDVTPFLQAADAFVLPSRAEGLPVALLEAMACALPCVGTATPGTTQVLEEGQVGRLVEVDDAAALADEVAAVLSVDSAHDEGQQARQHVVDHYSLDAVADRYVDLYTALT